MKKILLSFACLSFASIQQQLNAQLSFNPAVNFASGGYPFSISSSDFNGDGFQDIATANYYGDVSVFIGNGSGGFATAVSYVAGANPDGITAADVNADGFVDLIVTNTGSNDVSVLLGNGSGGFAAAMNYATGPGPQSSVAGDFNGDGNMDLAVANRNSTTLSVLLGNGSGAFAAPVNYSAGASPSEITSSDFNGDGNIDLATVNNAGNTITILLGDGSGVFSGAGSYPAGLSAFSLHAADLNHDGKTDIVTANTNSDDVSVFLGDGLGAFAAAVNYPTGGVTPYSVRSADFNKDGILDLVTANNSSNNISVLLGDGLGAFTAAGNYGTGSAPVALTTSDFDSDTRADVAVVNSSANTISVLTNVSVGPASALNFDGNNDYVITNSAITHGNQFTYEAWVKPMSANEWGGIMSTSTLNSESQWVQIALNSAGALRTEIADNAGNNKWYDGTTSLLGAWHHIAVSFDGTNLLFYVDGNVETTSVINNGTLGAMTINTQLNIGAERNHSVFYKGNIDEVRVWNIVRTRCEIASYKNCEIPTTATGLIANYHFNQGVYMTPNSLITALTDASNNAYNGTLTNFSLSGSSSNWVAPGAMPIGYITSLPPLIVGSLVTNSVICEGNPTTLTGTGADLYLWTNGISDGSPFTPTVTGTYTVTGSSLATGCTNTAIATVSVNPKPTMSVNSGTVCSGTLFVITPTGADTYTYSSGSANVNPTSDATYTITGADANGCENTVYSSVTVNPLPVVTVNSGTVCAGQPFTMVPGGALTYTFSDGSNMYLPTVGASYSVTSHGVAGEAVNGCIGYALSYITAYNPAVISATTNNTLLCTGQAATLSVTGATSYTWSTTETTTDIVVSPTAQTTYTVDGTDTNGCSNTTTITQDVSLCTGIAMVAPGASATINVYPNPTNGLFIVEVTSVSKVTVTNALGEVVLSETLEAGKHPLTIRDYATGIYFVKAIQNNKQEVIKIIKE